MIHFQKEPAISAATLRRLSRRFKSRFSRTVVITTVLIKQLHLVLFSLTFRRSKIYLL